MDSMTPEQLARCREESLVSDYANYAKDWSDEDFPITSAEKDAYEAGHGDGFNAGYQAAWSAAQAQGVEVKQLLTALMAIREVSGCAMDYGNNDDAVQKCYKISREAVGGYCMNRIVKETEEMGGYGDNLTPPEHHSDGEPDKHEMQLLHMEATGSNGGGE